MWENGFYTDNPRLRQGQMEMLNKGDYRGYLSLTYAEDCYDALLFLSNKGVRHRSLWNYVYAYARDGYSKLMGIIHLFDEGVEPVVTKSSDGRIKIYRGMTPKSAPVSVAFSWTTDKKKALYFATQENCSTGFIYTAKVHKDDVLGKIDIRDEKEVLINPASIEVVNQEYVYPPLTDKDIVSLKRTYGDKDIATLVMFERFRELGLLLDNIVNSGYFMSFKDTFAKYSYNYGNIMDMYPHNMLIRRGSYTGGVLVDFKTDMEVIYVLQNLNNMVIHGSANVSGKILNRYQHTLLKRRE